LVKAGLLLQAVLFLLFIMLAADFHRRAIKAGVMKPSIRTVLIVLYVSCSIITIRCIYRIVEFFEWGDGPLTHTEAYFWVFEAAIMFINTLMLNIWHPGRYLPRSNRIFLAKDGTEQHGPGWEDKRNKVVTFIDPFDLFGLFTGRDKKTRFWDMSHAELDALAEEHQKKKEAKLAAPRAFWKKCLEPFQLYGSQGHIVKWAKNLEKEDSNALANTSSTKSVGHSKAAEARAEEIV